MSIDFWSACAGSANYASRVEKCKADAAKEKWECLLSRHRAATDGVFDFIPLHAEGKRKIRSFKCPGCGSHSFIAASSGQICAYCRTPRTEEST